VNNHPWGP